MISIFENSELKTLAGCRGNVIHIRPHITPTEFFAYFQGECEGASSHKKLVLQELETHNWPLERIKNLIPTAEKVRRFLLLHELSHIRHQDHLAYKHMSHEEKTLIETRACIEALLQMAFEKAYAEPINSNTLCKLPESPTSARPPSSPSSWGLAPT